MNILVVGGGGREHAIITALAKFPKVDKIWAAPGNGGISALAECFPVKATDLDGILELAKKLQPDFVFVAPDDPLVMGMVDRLNEAGFKTFGPRANAAILEGSKVFSKALMKKYGIPTAGYETFTDADKAIEYIKAQNSYPAVIKCDGLALGKGVIIAKDFEEAKAAVNSMLLDGKFGKSGSDCSCVHRWQDCEAHDIFHGPQARQRQRRGSEHGRNGHYRPQPLLYRRIQG